jgi:ATP-dependent DNA helicase RecG
VKGDQAVVYGVVKNLKSRKTWKSRSAIAEAIVADTTGEMKVMWFHQPYLAKMLHEGSLVKLSGTVSGSERGLYLANPAVENTPTLPGDAHDSLFKDGTGSESLLPIYPESKGITSRWLYHAVTKAFKSGALEHIVDPIPEEILKRYNLPSLETSLVWIHTPKKEGDASAARKRFAFEEVFMIQLAKRMLRKLNDQEQARVVSIDKDRLSDFIKSFPFDATDAQMKAIGDIVSDFHKPHPMARLLEGDVGSGKTAVAASTAYVVATSRPSGQNFGNLQVAYMVPTEILAKQHFESFIQYFKGHEIPIGLLTSNECRKFPSKVNREKWTDISKNQLLKWIANGEIPILIGTHSLIQKAVRFKHLTYVIIDEQHRFGVAQRQSLSRKDAIAPHLLSMTATPIPRTLALTIYGDLDLTLLDQMPKGRKPIITEIVVPAGRAQAYEKIRRELKDGRQAYVICPRIDEPDPAKENALNAKSVKEEAKRLKKSVFQEFEIDILHSKMKPADKEKVMNRFSKGEIDILVATSVVEVGVNVPNATVILIEGAERFGLAQLHQLRGRVIRSNHQAYCFALAESQGTQTVGRLKALKTAKNGFELAEHDLNLRGAGELSGGKQWGVSDLAMEALKNLKMVEAARKEAELLIQKNPTLQNHALLKERVESSFRETHFE